MKRAGAAQAAASPPFTRSVAHRSPPNDARPSLTLEERVRYLFQIVDKSEALLLEEIDDLRAQVHSVTPRWTVGGRDGDGGASRWQDAQVYLHERRLEQAAITKLLAIGDENSACQGDVKALAPTAEATSITIADSWSHCQDQRIAELKNSNDQLADHVQALDAAVTVLYRRLDTMAQNAAVPHPSLVGQELHTIAVHSVSGTQRERSRRLEQDIQFQQAKHEVDQGVTFTAASPQCELQMEPQRAQRQDIVGLEDQCLDKPWCCSDLKLLHIQLNHAQRKRDEQVEINATLRTTIAALRETNGWLLHRLHVKDQHLRQCGARINKLWE